MKGSIINFVKIANSFFFFVGFIIVALFVVIEVYDANFRDKLRTHDSIQIEDNNDNANVPIKYKKNFVKKYEDVYMFRVRTNRLLSSSISSGTIVENFNMFSDDSNYNDFETVNFLFAKANSEPTLLLESHALVLDYHLITFESDPASYPQQFKTNKHLFTVILNDDNEDKVLDKKDRINLLASDYNGENLISIAQDITDYQVIGDYLLLITQRKEGKTITIIYNLATSSAHDLNTDLSFSESSSEH
ncbi:MAG: hypothetical protein ACJA11_003539 [Glaciecola sp.]